MNKADRSSNDDEQAGIPPDIARKPVAQKGRGAVINVRGRFERDIRETFDDGWQADESDMDGEDGSPRLKTIVTAETAKSILSYNQSPDIPFRVSLNPYRGCEHGCVYCFARPSHSFLGLSPGLDFEARLFAKINAAEVLRRELGRPGYMVESIAIGVNTDAYQPIEREWKITRAVLEVLQACSHPCALITKSALIERDIDLLADMARRNLVRAAVSITTLDHDIARRLEPRAASPTRRLRTIRTLAEAGIPTSVSVSPMIPFITDDAMESVLEAAAEAGAQGAHFIVLRLPWELNQVFQQWLQAHFPQRAERVMNRIREIHGQSAGSDKVYQSQFGARMRGQGVWADLLRQRFTKASARFGLNHVRPQLDCSLFRPPLPASPQLGLFDT